LGPYLKGFIFTQGATKQKLPAGNHQSGPDVCRIISVLGPSTLRLVPVKHSPNDFYLSAFRVLSKTH